MNTSPTPMVRTRWGGIAALVFAVLFFVGVTLTSDSPDTDASNAKWLRFYNDSGNRQGILVGAFVLGVAVIALLVFVGTLRERLRVIPGGTWLPTAGLAGGVVLAAMIAVFAAALAAVPATVEFPNGPVPRDPDIMRSLQSLGFVALLIFGMVGAGVLIVASSIAAGKTALFPRWMVIVGVIFGVIVVVLGFAFIPMVLLVIWALITGIFMLRRGAPDRARSPEPVAPTARAPGSVPGS